MLFPDAMRVDGLDVLPVAHLHALAARGLWGGPVPREAGGLGLSLPELSAVVEEIAGGCLATAFVWIQHLRLLTTLAFGPAPAALRDRWLEPACRGTLRGGIALTGLMSGPRCCARNRSRRLAAGRCPPWVTGWGLIDLVVVVARGPDDTVVNLIMDAAASQGSPYPPAALGGRRERQPARLDGVLIPVDRFISQAPFDPAASVEPEALRVHARRRSASRLERRLTARACSTTKSAACRGRFDHVIAAATGMRRPKRRPPRRNWPSLSTAALAVWDAVSPSRRRVSRAAGSLRRALGAGVRLLAG